MTAALMGGLAFRPGAWLAFAVISLVHVGGHALVLLGYGARIGSVRWDGTGGDCGAAHGIGPRTDAKVAWGGIGAQALLAVVAYAVSRRFTPASPLVAQLLHALVVPNLLLAAANLLPTRPFDGARAWKIIRRRDQRPRPSAEARSSSTGQSAKHPEFDFDADDRPSREVQWLTDALFDKLARERKIKPRVGRGDD